jgi:hypothetical protein
MLPEATVHLHYQISLLLTRWTILSLEEAIDVVAPNIFLIIGRIGSTKSDVVLLVIPEHEFTGDRGLLEVFINSITFFGDQRQVIRIRKMVLGELLHTSTCNRFRLKNVDAGLFLVELPHFDRGMKQYFDLKNEG